MNSTTLWLDLFFAGLGFGLATAVVRSIQQAIMLALSGRKMRRQIRRMEETRAEDDRLSPLPWIPPEAGAAVLRRAHKDKDEL